jgi:hypothetical protein
VAVAEQGVMLCSATLGYEMAGDMCCWLRIRMHGEADFRWTANSLHLRCNATFAAGKRSLAMGCKSFSGVMQQSLLRVIHFGCQHTGSMRKRCPVL